MPESLEGLEPVPFKIMGSYDKQKFIQFNPEDTANWYVAASKNGKNQYAMYPTTGRKHINFLNRNRLIFSNEPRGLFKTVNFYYVVDGSKIFRIDKFFNQVEINPSNQLPTTPHIFFTYLTFTTMTFVVFVDGQNMYIYREELNTFNLVTDPNIFGQKPIYVATFGNRIVVAFENSTQFNLSITNLLLAGVFNPATCFTPAVFAQENGFIRQLAVFKNILYIFTDYTTGIWANIASTFSGSGTTFPFKKNTSFEWDYGMADPQSIAVGFSRMTWLGQNADGLVQVLNSDGSNPKPISTRAIELLFQKDAVNGQLSPFVELNANGFLYQIDNTIMYRLSAGIFRNLKVVDFQEQANCIEYNFDLDEWHRVIELNGERNRIVRHIFFDNRHLVTVQGETTVYEMSDQFYSNEVRNIAQDNPQASDAYDTFPFRYERVTPIIREPDDGEFETYWAQVDFVWGFGFIHSDSPFANTVFIIDEESDPAGDPIYMVDETDPNKFIIKEGSNTPDHNALTYNALFKPHIELYFSDDGGISYSPADVLEFSQLGVYLWRMRWYQLGCSRDRVYKLVCVSPTPIVLLGGLLLMRRVSDGAS